MNFRSKGILLQIAVRAMLLATCILVAFSSVAHTLIPSRLLAHTLVASESSPTHHSSVPEEAPPETPGSNEPTKEGEISSISPRRKSQQAVRFDVRGCHLGWFFDRYLPASQVTHVGGQTPSPQFEHCYRNGCGADLRC